MNTQRILVIIILLSGIAGLKPAQAEVDTRRDSLQTELGAFGYERRDKSS